MASDYLLELDGIKGESQDKKHKETIEIQSFSWGAVQPMDPGTHAPTGKTRLQPLQFTARVNKASPLLFKAITTGKPIKKATLYVRKAGGQQEDYYTVTLSDCRLSSYQSGGSEGSNTLPVDQFALHFNKIKFAYQPQDEKGKLGGAILHEWDIGSTS